MIFYFFFNFWEKIFKRALKNKFQMFLAIKFYFKTQI